MVFSAYLLENAIWVLSSGWEICTQFLSPRGVFVWPADPTVEYLQLFQNKMTNAPRDGHAWK